MAYIGFGKISIQMLYILGIAIFHSIRHFTPMKIELSINEEPKDLNCLISILLIFIAEVIGGSISLIRFCMNNQENERYYNDWFEFNSRAAYFGRRFDYQETKLKAKGEKIVFFLCPLFTLLDFFSLIVFYLSKYSQLVQLPMILFQMLSAVFFSVLILKNKLFRHHYFSLASFILCIVINSLVFIFINIYITIDTVIYLSLAYMLIGLKNTIEKYLIKVCLYNPLKLLFSQGISGIAITFIFIWIVSSPSSVTDLFNFSLLNQQGKSFFNQGIMFWLYLIIFIASSTGKNMLIFIANEEFGPTHLMIGYFTSSFIVHIINVSIGSIEEYTTWGLISFAIVFYIIILALCLVYNEVLLLNFFDLQNYTQPQIKLRSQEEVIAMTVELLGNDVHLRDRYRLFWD